MPTTRFFENFETCSAVQHIASSGLDTITRIAFGLYLAACSVALRTIS